MNDEPLRTRAEAAAFLGVSVRTLDSLAYTGRGPRYFRVGRQSRYAMADLLAWLDSRAVEPRTAERRLRAAR
jgi:predicted DNA-binding transcriptional regulator AlpA